MTFEDWASKSAAAIATARGVSVEDLATEPAELTQQIARARQHFVAMGQIKADASSWVNKAKAMAVETVRKIHADCSASERKILAEADPIYLAALKIRDEIAVTVSALRGLSFEIMNGRRADEFDRKMHDSD